MLEHSALGGTGGLDREVVFLSQKANDREEGAVETESSKLDTGEPLQVFLLIQLEDKPWEPSYTVGGNVSWRSHSGKMELPYDSAIPLLGIYPDKTII